MAWQNATPGSTDKLRNSQQDILDNFNSLKDTLNEDHKFTSGGSEVTGKGKHDKITLVERATPSPSSDEGMLYTKDVGGTSELFYRDDNNAERQLSTGGKLNIVAADIPTDEIDDTKINLTNDGYLTGRNNADDGDVNILKVNASDEAELGEDGTTIAKLADGSKLASSAAPTADAEIANKKYVDNYVDNNTTDDTETNVKNKSWTIDEDDMSSDDDTKVPTQQSTKAYVDTEAGLIKKDGSTPFTGEQSMGINKITDVVNPVDAQDAATKNYIDGEISGATGFSSKVSRSKDTNYTPSTDGFIWGYSDRLDDGDYVQVKIGGNVVMKADTGGGGNASKFPFFVPICSGETYRIECSHGITAYWTAVGS